MIYLIMAKLAVTATLSVILIIVSSSPLVVKKEFEQTGVAVPFYELTKLYRAKDRLLLSISNDQTKRKKECGLVTEFKPIDCELCSLFVDGLKEIVEQGRTQDDVVEFATWACKTFKIEDDRVCKSITVEFKDELFGVTEKLALSPKEACGVLLGSNCGTPYDPTTMWNITLPPIPKPPVVPPKPPKAGSPTLRLLHLTDIHLDLMYEAGTKADCGEPLCCRRDDGKPDKGQTGAGMWGDYRNCDTPIMTLKNLFQHLNSIQDQFDYVVFTGDLPAHNVWNQSRADQLNVLQQVIQMFETYLPNKQIFHALGNHESAPVNSFPPPFITGKDSEQWLYTALAEAWGKWLPQYAQQTILKGAYYSVTPFPGLKIISLNMNMCNNENWWLLINTTDPAGQLQWFINELQSSEIRGEKVHIIGHISPGSGSCLKPFSWNYYKIINRYENIVAGQFFGHSHSDFYEVIYDDVSFTRPISVVYIPGSVTTYSNLNPAYRIYELDGNYTESSWQVLDFTNYFLNLTAANRGAPATWDFEYNAKTAYGLKSLYPNDWNDLIYRMKEDDTLFQTFHKYVSKSADLSQCTGDCKRNQLCALKTGRSNDPNLCKDL